MQKIRIRDTDIDLSVEDMCYPFLENGILYLRLVILNYAGEPTEFLTITPADILYRTSPYDQEIMDEINTASDQAREDQVAWIAKQEDIRSSPRRSSRVDSKTRRRERK
jgi:hypothetical protein